MNNRIKNHVYEYVREHPRSRDDEIAEALKLHTIDVLNALSTLEEEGKVKSVEELE